jgi:hypothetical protein
MGWSVGQHHRALAILGADVHRGGPWTRQHPGGCCCSVRHAHFDTLCGLLHAQSVELGLNPELYCHVHTTAQDDEAQA